MKAQNNLRLWIVGLIFFSEFTFGAIAGGKRTIFTAGEKVFPIDYQLGQSTILFFGTKPEIVICGNKNYFNIEKIKEAVTIQPLASISTNLTVMSGNKRYLFYLRPSANGSPADSFVDIRWVEPSVIKDAPQVNQGNVEVLAINQKIEIIPKVTLFVRNQILLKSAGKSFLDLEIQNQKSNFQTKDVDIKIIDLKGLTSNQTMLWYKDELKENESTKGRLIFTDLDFGRSKNRFIEIAIGGHKIKIGLNYGKKR